MQNINEQLIQKYSNLLAQANHDKLLLEIENEQISKELKELKIDKDNLDAAKAIGEVENE